MNNLKRKNLQNIFSPSKIYLAVFLGLGMTSYLFYSQNEEKNVYAILKELAQPTISWIFIAILFLLVRDLGYIFRIRYLTSKELDWKASTYTILLWEFASAITPSVVGGTTIAIFILSKEGIKFGKALAYVMLTAILDNSFFLLAALLILVSSQDIFPQETSIFLGISLPIASLFYISYSLIAIYTFFMVYGLLAKPRAFKWILLKITSFKLFKHWKKNAIQYGDEINIASQELKNKGHLYWFRSISSTIFIWCARYLLLNCLFAAYTNEMNFITHLDIFAKQIILWVTQLISPTPGGSGFAIYFLSKIFAGGSLVVGIGLIWRILTYFSYLILGSIALPRWIRRVFL